MDTAILVAHYDHDIGWVDNINIKKFIYSKTNKNYNFIEPNKGQESLCYLRYIIDNYNNLPDKTLFSHDHRMSYHQDFNMDDIILKVNWNADLFFSVNKRDFYQKEISMNANREIYIAFLKDNWRLFEKYLTFPSIFSYYSCAQFVVDKGLILQYPIEFYQSLVDFLIETHLDNFTTSRIFEYTWHYIFTRNSVERVYNYSDIFLR